MRLPIGFSGKLAVAVALLALAPLTGCKGSNPVPNSEGADETSGDSDSGSAMGLQSINFEFDSFSLSSSAKKILKSNASILKDKPSMAIQVEGHCDDRGSIQYNLALGEKRAGAVRNYLIDLGVAGRRLTTISFGEERPLVQGGDESAWAKNRRANFAITSQ